MLTMLRNVTGLRSAASILLPTKTASQFNLGDQGTEREAFIACRARAVGLG